ncbi:MAG: hypothetical protein JXB50_13685 [Spirochaetes bacterium]|nr:hypothetical protein [Spirochaetota bacterium]
MKKYNCFFLILLICSCFNNPFLETDLNDLNDDVKYVNSGPCDMDLSIDSIDPVDAAHAIGICDGLIAAQWVLPDGSDKPENPNFELGHGILPDFGPNIAIREGVRLLAISSGTARRPTDPGFAAPSFDKGYTNSSPSGYPIYEEGSLLPGDGHDGIALRVILKIPSGVKGFSIDYKYYTREYPDYIKTEFVDQCCAILIADSASTHENILFDESGNPLLTSSSAITVYDGCPYGNTELIGTGFESYGATRWITAELTTDDMKFKSKEQIEIIFAVWDTHDGIYDTTLLLDNFQWIPLD